MFSQLSNIDTGPLSTKQYRSVVDDVDRPEGTTKTYIDLQSKHDDWRGSSSSNRYSCFYHVNEKVSLISTLTSEWR